MLCWADGSFLTVAGRFTIARSWEMMTRLVIAKGLILINVNNNEFVEIQKNYKEVIQEHKRRFHRRKLRA